MSGAVDSVEGSRLDLGLGLGEAARGAGMGRERDERMEAGAAAGAPYIPAPLGWAGNRPPTALLLAWPGERAVGCAWAAVPPIGPIGPSFSGRAWTCPWAGIEAQARPVYRARAVLGSGYYGPGFGPYGYRAKWPSITSCTRAEPLAVQ